MNAIALFLALNDRIQYTTFQDIIYTDEYVSWVKGNVSDHVNTLLSTPRDRRFSRFRPNFADQCSPLLFTDCNQSVIELVQFIIEEQEYPPIVANALEHCTLSAYTNLTRMKNVIQLDPLDYGASVELGMGYCLEDKGAVEYWLNHEVSNFTVLQHVLFWAWPSAVLLGPYAEELTLLFFNQEGLKIYEW